MDFNCFDVVSSSVAYTVGGVERAGGLTRWPSKLIVTLKLRFCGEGEWSLCFHTKQFSKIIYSGVAHGPMPKALVPPRKNKKGAAVYSQILM